MTTAEERSRHASVAEWFAKLSDLSPAEQDRAIEAANLDPAVSAELRALLGLDRAAPSVLDSSRLGIQVASFGTTLGEDPVPESIGSYRIVRLLGRGGMGSVYEAEQTHPRRRVALKVVNAVVAVPEVLRRFQHEAHVLGLLQHPGIAQIIEAGTFDHGRGAQPFFAMEFVAGSPLDEFARERGLDVSARLSLFARVCDAVHHAHQRGVIHRDLKPANILVTADGTPKVLDFGVARVSEVQRQETMLTAIGQILGTLGFMSPEQARGDADLDITSDVYTLGIVLYSLLSGHMPYEVNGKTLPDALRIVIEQEPKRLESVAPNLRGDIATIVHKALEKAKERRYESAAALADDIRRFLDHQPITARPATAIYQLRKFARRNRGLVAGLCGFVVLLIAATTVAITLTMQKERERADADSVAQFLSDLFVAAIPTDRDPSSLTALEVLDAGVARLDRYTANQPVRRAVLLEALGRTYRELSVHDRAEKLLREALAIRLEHLGEEHADTLETMATLGVLCRKIGLTDESIELNERALAGRRALFGVRHDLVTQSMNNLAVSYQAVGRSEEALVLLDEASSITIEMLGVEDDRAITQRANYGLQLAVAGRKEAVPLMEDLYASARRALGDHHVATLHTGYGLGLAFMKADRFREAADVLGPVYLAEKEVFGERSLDTASAGYFLGDSLRRLGEPRRGFDLLAEAHDIGVEALGEGHDWVLNVQLKAALALIDLGELDAARVRASNALSLAQASKGAARSKIPEATRILADLDARQASDDDK